MLTFDDGPDAEFTAQILDILAREHVPATFFVIGERVVKNPEVLQTDRPRGHMVGNHTMTHLDFDTQTDFRNQEEIVATDRIIRAEAGYATPLFRIPTGGPSANPWRSCSPSNSATSRSTSDWTPMTGTPTRRGRPRPAAGRTRTCRAPARCRWWTAPPR